MSIPEDIDLALSPWNVTATIASATVSVNFDGAYAEFSDIEGTAPAIICNTSDLPAGVVIGSSVVIGSDSYTVAAVEPDGTGVTVLRLESL